MRLLFLLLFLVGAAHASNVLIFETNQTAVVRGRAIAYLLSVDTPQYSGRADVLVNPTLPNHPLEWTKTNGAGLVVAMSTAESNSILTARANLLSNLLAQAQITSKNTSTNYFDNLDDSTKRVIRALAEVTRQAVNTNRVADGFTPITVIQWRDRVLQEINAQPNTQ